MENIEKGRKKDQVAQILESGNNELNRVLAHPLIPTFVQKHLSKLTARIYDLTDAQYIDVAIESELRGDHTSEEIESARKYIWRSTAGFVSSLYSDNKPAIIVKRSYLETDPKALESWPFLLEEEMGHALYKSKAISFPDLPEIKLSRHEDQNYYLGIFQSKDEAWKAIESRLKFGSDIINKEDVEAKLVGFKTVFHHVKTHREAIFFEIPEELRATIIQIIFESVRLGMRLGPNIAVEEQYVKGSSMLKMKGYPRVMGVLPFIEAYLVRQGGIKKGLESLFKGLYYKDAQKFYDSLGEYNLKEKFVAAEVSIAKDQEERNNLPRNAPNLEEI